MAVSVVFSRDKGHDIRKLKPNKVLETNSVRRVRLNELNGNEKLKSPIYVPLIHSFPSQKLLIEMKH